MNDKLLQTLGQSVTLIMGGEYHHFDDGVVHILTTSPLSLLHELFPESSINSRRFRPNIIVDSR